MLAPRATLSTLNSIRWLSDELSNAKYDGTNTPTDTSRPSSAIRTPPPTCIFGTVRVRTNRAAFASDLLLLLPATASAALRRRHQERVSVFVNHHSPLHLNWISSSPHTHPTHLLEHLCYHSPVRLAAGRCRRQQHLYKPQRHRSEGMESDRPRHSQHSKYCTSASELRQCRKGCCAGKKSVRGISSSGGSLCPASREIWRTDYAMLSVEVDQATVFLFRCSTSPFSRHKILEPTRGLRKALRVCRLDRRRLRLPAVDAGDN